MKKGYVVLGYETNTFHSYLCNGLEKEFKNQFDFSLNENGFIKSLAEAERCCDIANDENIEQNQFFGFPGLFLNTILIELTHCNTYINICLYPTYYLFSIFQVNY
ncbi:hypothetical protein ACFWM3_11525 [Gottfriedia sp. NPDC058432]|uniref:hypothetical protein n=1 Tax=Gottfriedia sp. NPDC058432 TaxID=3346497 RepID=UPI00365F7C67